jgi:Helicase conserved C-terminal domain
MGPTVRCVPLCPQSGYPCLSLHGGKDQSDRESTISDFKSNVCNVLVATSVAARGLDVKDLVRCVCWSISTTRHWRVSGSSVFYTWTQLPHETGQTECCIGVCYRNACCYLEVFHLSTGEQQ